MGKSDPYIFSAYLQSLESTDSNKFYDNVCFLGNTSHNAFTSNIKTSLSEFHDLAINGWDINNVPWKITDKKFNLVVCTRCAYFSKSPEIFFNEISRILAPGGRFIVDWGLGDHWRFSDYKIGWKKNGEHEHAYDDDNFLWSTVWHDSFSKHPEFIKFQEWVKKLGYEDVEKSIKEEVPVVFNLNNLKNKFSFTVNMLTLWEDSPQIYFIMSGIKK